MTSMSICHCDPFEALARSIHVPCRSTASDRPSRIRCARDRTLEPSVSLRTRRWLATVRTLRTFETCPFTCALRSFSRHPTEAPHRLDERQSVWTIHLRCGTRVHLRFPLAYAVTASTGPKAYSNERTPLASRRSCAAVLQTAPRRTDRATE
ncbi:hypothetical protein BD309DRAFT_711320 [Dichomitus squalens]|nr:hypothetical protein BD309DRAFT_711320 [Dichomitus squalens]